MRRIRQVYSIFLVAFAFSVQAQLDSNWLTLGSAVNANRIGTFSMEASATLSSNAINSGMVLDFLTKPTFSENSRNTYNSSNLKSSNIFYTSNSKLNYILNDKWEIEASISDLVYYKAGTRLSQLLLNGNKAYLNEHIASKNAHVQRISRANLSVFNRFEIKQHTLRINYGLSYMPEYFSVRATGIDLFNSSDSIALSTQSNKYEGMESPGVGLQLGFSLYGSFKNNHRYAINVSDANLYYVNDGERNSWAQNVTFTGINFPFNKPFEKVVESELTNTLGWETKRNTTLLILPTIEMSYLIPLKASQVSFNAQSFYALYTLASCWHKPVSNNFLLNLGLDGGNFQAIRTRTGFEYKAKRVSATLNLLGLNSLITTALPGGFGAEFGFCINP